ncbi:MAG TPA: TlpA disulfide reductase family protein [Thermoanaerobaculaceae bacterium]|nr:TlpA disulfide reductase family protein [Thermoanaerobaculaceae bacterium]HRS15725.1 TlpA disulfide reductase family protein [Thermoanaerobaculaceae bacterium]
MKTRTLLAASLVLLMGTLVSGENSRPVFPSVTLTDLDGRVVDIKNYQGAVVLLNFWATWCGPCRIELPELQKLYGELGGRGFVVLAVAVDTPVAKVRPFMDRLGLTMPALLMDARSQRALGIDRIPFSILLDRESRVVQIYPGYSPEIVDDIRRRAEALLAAGTQGGK